MCLSVPVSLTLVFVLLTFDIQLCANRLDENRSGGSRDRPAGAKTPRRLYPRKPRRMRLTIFKKARSGGPL
uniref:Putative secreted peptide n=1 Tax=Anopheles braziliensis TaxID=58242 RepID=A0A2M3ZWL5_9DIPT